MSAARRADSCRLRVALTCALVLVCMLSAQRAVALGTEAFGNAPVVAQEDWPPGVVDAVNLKSRVYTRWVNGNESFFFRGDGEALAETIRRFAAIESPGLEVVLLPDVGGTRSFEGKAVSCDWEIHVPSGIYLGMARREKGTRVFARHPRLIIFAGSERVEVDELEIPAKLPVIGVSQLLERYVQALGSKDPHVVGQAAYSLGTLAAAAPDPKPLVAVLDAEDDYSRRCAAHALQRLGPPAAAALPRLRELSAAAADETHRKPFEDAILGITDGASPRSPEYDAVRARLEKVFGERFRASIGARGSEGAGS